jgi:hypothetical protein
LKELEVWEKEDLGDLAAFNVHCFVTLTALLLSLLSSEKGSKFSPIYSIVDRKTPFVGGFIVVSHFCLDGFLHETTIDKTTSYKTASIMVGIETLSSFRTQKILTLNCVPSTQHSNPTVGRFIDCKRSKSSYV